MEGAEGDSVVFRLVHYASLLARVGLLFVSVLLRVNFGWCILSLYCFVLHVA